MSVTLSVIVLASACTGPSGDGTGTGDQSDDAAVASVDEVVRMRQGGFAEFPVDLVGDFAEVRQTRHVLRSESEIGPIDMFDVVIRGRDGAMERCISTSFGTELGMICDPGDSLHPQDGDPLFYGTYSAEGMFLYLLVDPPTTTHFSIAQGDQRIAVIAVEGWNPFSTFRAVPRSSRSNRSMGR